jgi:hypothetical protein
MGAVNFGITSNFNGVAPSQGCIQETSLEITCEVATIKGPNGQTKQAQAKPLRTGTVTIKSKGSAVLATMSSSRDMTGMTVTSSKYTESNNDFPTSEVTSTYYN